MFPLLLKKEFHCLVRSRHSPIGLFVFALVLVVIASFAFRKVGYGQEELRQLTPGILWTVFLFCGVVTLNYSFLPEEEGGAMSGLLLTGIDPFPIYAAKFIANFAFLLILQTFVLIIHSVLFGVDYRGAFLPLFGLSGLVVVGFSGLGTLLSAISVSVPGRELALAILLFPLSLPLISAAVLLTQEVLRSGVLPSGDFWFLLVLCFDVISLALAWGLFEHLVRE